jgi:hypothetical protein
MTATNFKLLLPKLNHLSTTFHSLSISFQSSKKFKRDKLRHILQHLSQRFSTLSNLTANHKMIQPNLQAFNPCIFKCTSTSCKKLATMICLMSRQLSLTISFSRKKLIIKSRVSVSRKIRNLRKRRISSS